MNISHALGAIKEHYFSKGTLKKALMGDYGFYTVFLLWCILPNIGFVFVLMPLSMALKELGFQSWGFLLFYSTYAVIYLPISITILRNSRHNTDSDDARIAIPLYIVSVILILFFFLIQGLFKFRLNRAFFPEYAPSILSIHTYTAGGVILSLMIVSLFFLFRKYPPQKTIKVSTIIGYSALFFTFVVAAIVPIVFKKEFSELRAMKKERSNDALVSQFNDAPITESVNVNIEISDGTKATLVIPSAYLVVGDQMDMFGRLRSGKKIQLSTVLPDLQPWKMDKKVLENIQSRSKARDDNSDLTASKILMADADYISINFTANSPFEYTDIPKIRETMSILKLGDLPSKEEYGLSIYDTELKVPQEIEGRLVTVYEKGLVATPTDENKYPPMVMSCGKTCTLYFSYNQKIGMFIQFHPARLDNWHTIWEKVNNKIDSMITWQ